MKQYFAYIRVSTVRQGEQGVSLRQQKDAIERYAQRNQLEICRWFEEQETAAKQGRPRFGEMVRLLRREEAAGVIIHKIDRSARNLKDWADLGELIDRGIEVHFANEALDLTSRGGRLSADIQAVVAADYVRNLREETKKGFYGRLKQGLFPMPAPLGYLDVGAGNPKQIDPRTAPLVRRIFELYASGVTSFAALLADAASWGLCSRSGKPLSKNGLSRLLNNPFYAGLIHVKKTGQSFAGAHEPLISKATFDRVQDILRGKINTRSIRHDFLFRRRLACKACGYTLIGETHKGHVYYRCQTSTCPTTSIREEAVDSALLQRFSGLQLSREEQRYCWQEAQKLKADRERQHEDACTALRLKLAQIDQRQSRLTDAYIDRLIDKDSFEQRKTALLSERLEIEQALKTWESGKRSTADELLEILERGNSAYSAYKRGIVPEKRALVDTLTSNRRLNGQSLEIFLSSPFDLIAERNLALHGSPRRDIHLTWQRLLLRLGAVLLEGNE